MAIVKIQHRRGNYADYDPSKVLPGELVVTQADDPNSNDGEAVYIATTAGNVKRLAVAEELDSAIETALQDAIPEVVSEATQEAEAAADRAEVAAQTLEIDTTLTKTNQAAEAKAVGDEIADLKDDLRQFQESGNMHFDPADFQVGGIDINTGDVIPSHTKRVVMTNMSIAAYDMTLTVDSAHKMMIAYYTNNVFEDVSNWKAHNSIAINKGQQYRVVIADYPTETASTSVNEKVSGISCTSIFSNLLSCVAFENETWG